MQRMPPRMPATAAASRKRPRVVGVGSKTAFWMPSLKMRQMHVSASQ
jgi:hypothetical protein